MDEIFESHGIRFRYPGFWEINVEETPDEFSVTVESENTTFWSLTLIFDRPNPLEIIEASLDIFREEYDEIDVYEKEVELCDLPAVSRDIEFVCLELVNSAFLRAFQTNRFTALVLFQGTDRELVESKEILEAISESLQLADNDAD